MEESSDTEELSLETAVAKEGTKIPLGCDDMVYVVDDPARIGPHMIYDMGYSFVRLSKDEHKRAELEDSGIEYAVWDWCKISPNTDITVPGIKIAGDISGCPAFSGPDAYFEGVKYLGFLTELSGWTMEPEHIFSSPAAMHKDYLRYNDKQYLCIYGLAFRDDDTLFGKLKEGFGRAFRHVLENDDKLSLDCLTQEGIVNIGVDCGILQEALDNCVWVGIDKNVSSYIGLKVHESMKGDSAIDQGILDAYEYFFDRRIETNPMFRMGRAMRSVGRILSVLPGVKQGLEYLAKKMAEKVNDY